MGQGLIRPPNHCRVRGNPKLQGGLGVECYSKRREMNTDKLSLNQKHILELFEKEEYLSVGKIVKLLKIPHPTVKQSLNRLLQYNLIGRRGIGKGTYYYRKDENVILDTLGNQLVTIYQGKDAFTDLFEKIANSLKKGDFYWSFAFRGEYHDPQVKEFFISLHHKLADKGVEDKTIVHRSVENLIRKTYRNVPNPKIKATTQEVPFGMTILKDRVINLVWDEKPVAIAIHIPKIVKRYQEFFRFIWQNK